ncbi:MAG TPA: DHA2 family efflux MFS transporter permease subunit [Methylomirabilota bacterium]|jgi:EmrB/QacA subfamily drug resistance transporter|nr:DHA2 family efflux MFS transporter permease subunit [Methylomirabilota bacterium]
MQKEADSAPGAILAAAILASSMAFLDTSVVALALPTILSDLGGSVVAGQWVVEAYLLFMTSLLLVGGALGDRFGRKRVFGWGIWFFALASLGCALAQSTPQLVLARAVQGIGAAVMVPGSLALISAGVRPEARGRALGLWSAATSIATAFGPPAGGWVITLWSWPPIFLVNLPLAAIALLALRTAPESRAEESGAIDWLGASLATLGLGALTFALLEAGRSGLSPAVVVALAVGTALIAAFLMVERRAAAPMLPLDLFGVRAFATVQLFTVLLYAGLMAAIFVLPFALAERAGFSPAETGLALLPSVALIGLLSRWAGALADRHGPRTLLIVGSGLAAAGFALLGLGEGSYAAAFLPGLLVMGLGMACCVAPVSKAALDAAPAERAGIASAVNNMASRLGGLFAVAALGLLMPPAEDGASATVAAGYRPALLGAAALAALAMLAAIGLPRRAFSRAAAAPSRSR